MTTFLRLLLLSALLVVPAMAEQKIVVAPVANHGRDLNISQVTSLLRQGWRVITVTPLLVPSSGYQVSVTNALVYTLERPDPAPMTLTPLSPVTEAQPRVSPGAPATKTPQ